MTEQAGDAGQLSRAGRLPGSRLVFSFQYLIGAVYLLGAGANLLTASIRTGDYAGLLDPRLERFGDPKDYIPPIGPDSVWNPLTWIFGLAHTGALYVTPLAIFAGIAGAAYLFNPGLRADRRVFRHLVIGTAICVALVVLAFTPYGKQLQNWMLD